jgi:hypothetical protein
MVAGSLSNTDALLIVTLRTLIGASAVESPELGDEPDPIAKVVIDRYNGVCEKLEEETARTSADVLVTVQDRDVSVLQSRIAEGGTAGPPLPAGGVEAKFGEGLTGGDLWGWIRSVFDHIDEDEWHPIVRPADDTVGTLADTGRIAVVGDWGTNLAVVKT